MDEPATARSRPELTRLDTRGTRCGLRIAAAVAAGVLGGLLAVAVAGGTSHQLGPLDVHLHVRLSLHGGTTVQVAPLGSLRLDSHDGPLQLSARVTDVRPGRSGDRKLIPAGWMPSPHRSPTTCIPRSRAWRCAPPSCS